jgi:Family of unknown function (DUF6502)
VTSKADSPIPDAAAALTVAFGALLRPLARLAVAKGVTAREVEELLRAAFIAAAQDAQPADAPKRQVSRIATATGLTRREVARLLSAGLSAPSTRRSPATEVFSRWLTAPELQDGGGKPLELDRQGPGASFEALAQSVTRDVHSRSLLDELRRLGLAEVDEERATVRLLKERFVPEAGDARLMGLLGHNVGDHLEAAVANVLSPAPRHLEQAVFADELSPEALPRVRELVQLQWQALMKAVVPVLQQLIDADRTAGRAQTQRVRIGLYSFSKSTVAPPAFTPAKPAPRRRTVKRATATPTTLPGDSHEK